MKEDYRQRCREQVRELFRLASEAEACASLLRQEAERYQALLEDDNLPEEVLRELATEREDLRLSPLRFTRVTERLM